MQYTVPKHDNANAETPFFPLKKRFDENNEVGEILAYNEELGDKSILWHHSDIPEDLWVIGTNGIASGMSNAANFRPILEKFRNILLKLGQPTPDLIYGIHHLLGLKLLTRLRLGLSHLKGARKPCQHVSQHLD